MGASFKIPVVGSNVNPVTESDQGPGDLRTQGQLDDPSAQVADPVQNNPAPTVPAKPRELFSPNRRFSPDFDPEKFELGFNQYGKVVVKPKEPMSSGQEPAVTSSDSLTGNLPGDPQAPVQPTAPPASADGTVAAMQNQINQLTQVVLSMAQGGQTQAQPTQEAHGPTPPDPAKFDFYDAAQAAEYHRLNNAYIQDLVKSTVQQSMGATQTQVAQMTANQQIDAAMTKYGSDVFRAREPMLVELAKGNPGATVQQLWDMSDTLLKGFVPTTQQPRAGDNPPTQPASRTITPDQARQKADQAARLPRGNSGVQGAGPGGPPSNVKGLGNLMAWRLSQRGT